MSGRRSALVAVFSITLALFCGSVGLEASDAIFLRQDFGQHRRMALVLGNNAYKDYPLDNSVNDARDMSGLLTRAGFQVTLVLDAGSAATAAAIDNFAARLQIGDIAMFYYSGHGMEIDGSQYLSPIDCEAPDDVLYKNRAVSLSRVMKLMEHSGTWLNILIVDACRTDPYKGAEASSPNLSPSGLGHGTVIIFGTSPNVTASDNADEENGLFTRHLLEEMRAPGATLSGIFHRASNRTYEASLGMQKPWLAISRSGGEFILFPTAAQAAAAGQVDEDCGTLLLSVNEGEAEVFVDGLTVAFLQGPGPHEIKGIRSGPRRVTVMKRGFQTDVYRKSFDVAAGEVTSVAANLSVGMTADYVLDRALEFIGGEQAIRSVNSLRGQGAISIPAMRVSSQVDVYWKRPKKMRMEMTLGRLRFHQWTDGHGYWQQLAGQQAFPVGGEEAGGFMHMASLEGPYVDRWSSGVDARYGGLAELEGRKLHYIVVTYDDGMVKHQYYNVDDFRLEVEKTVIRTRTGREEVYVKYDDFRKVNNIMMAFKLTAYQNGILLMSYQGNSVVFNVPVADSLFAAP